MCNGRRHCATTVWCFIALALGFLLPNAADQRLATLDYQHRPILSRVRCIGLFCDLALFSQNWLVVNQLCFKRRRAINDFMPYRDHFILDRNEVRFSLLLESVRADVP